MEKYPGSVGSGRLRCVSALARAILALAAFLPAVGLLALLLGSAVAPAQTQRPSGSQTFNYDDGRIVPFVVPDDVLYIHVDARGGHGGSVGNQGKGGRPGEVTAVLPVSPGDVLGVQVGRWGGAVGGPGCGNGGDHGATWGPSSGHSGAGGGGGTCVLAQAEVPGGWAPLVIAGGGGGGGGDDSDGALGGAGGDGGLHSMGGGTGLDETHKPNDEGRVGGCGGCRNSPNGASGEGTDFGEAVGAGGGGGGGGWRGGEGGDNGVYMIDQTEPIGGGGGGGGASWTAPTVLAVQHSVSSAPCEHHDPPEPTCDGSVTLSWGLPPATAVASAGNHSHAGIGQDFPTLAVTVSDADGIPLNDVSVEFEAPGSGPSGSFPSGVTSVTVQTDQQGVATAPRLVANETAGQWTLEAAVEGLSAPVRFDLTNDPAATTTTVTSTVNPSVVGEEVGFTATVSAGPAFHSLLPTGQVVVTIDGAPVGAPIPLDPATGKAVVPASRVPPLSPGAHEVSAAYLGDGGHLPSLGTLSQGVDKAATTVELISGPNPAPEGLAVAFQATVRPQAQSEDGPTPTGSITFEEADGTELATQPLGPEGFALWETEDLPVGVTKVIARYAGDANYEPGTGSVYQSVGPAATATQVSASKNPAAFGEELRWTATVRRQVAGAPLGGEIHFELDGTEVCEPQAVDEGGSVTCEPGAALAVGEHSVEAFYEPELGSGVEASQGSLEQRVVPARTSLDLAVEPEPSRLGVPVTLQGTVTALAPSTATPAGQVQFAVDGEAAGSPVELTEGEALLPASCELPPIACNLAVGAHPVEAEFSPGGSEVSGARAAAVHWVAPAPTTTSVESSANPQRAGEPVRFTARVEAASGAPWPFGTVQFFADGAPISGPIGLVNGRVVSPELGSLAPGPHEITARFLGSPGYSESEGSLSQRITRVTPPQLRIVSRRARVRPNGSFRLRVRCGGTEGQRCFAATRLKSARRVRLAARRRAPRGTRIAFRAVSLPTGAKRRVRFDLTRLGIEILAHRRSLPVRARLRAQMGTLAPRAQRLRLVAPKRGVRAAARLGGGR